MIVSPCKGCKNEFEDKNKHPDCKICTLPIEYVSRIGRSPSSSMELEVQKMNDEKAIVAPPKVNYKKASESTSSPAPPKILLSETDQLVEDHIETMCEDHGMTIEDIRAGMQGAQDPDRRQKFHNIRDRIIKSLVSDEVFGRLTQVDIGKILSMSGASVSHRIQKMGILPVNPRRARGEYKKTSKRKKPKIVTLAEFPETKETPTNQLTINFSDHQETLERIRKAAKNLMREPEAQVLFWLVHSDFEKLEGLG